MFYKESSARRTLDGWVRELLVRITQPGSDGRTLDEITTTEILDMAYIQGAALESSVAAHALFPQYVEESERIGGPSAMSVTFPVAVDGLVPVRVRVLARWGQASALQIGDGRRGKVVNPRHAVPDVLRRPRIGGTIHDLGEPAGDRLRTIAGPMREALHVVDVIVDRAEGDVERMLASPADDRVYGTVDRSGALDVEQDPDGNLVGRAMPRRARQGLATYLWGETRAASVVLRVSWVRQRADRILLTVTLRNTSVWHEDDRASATLLAALLMPHLLVTVEGGDPDFPPLQYAESKRHLLTLRDEDDRRRASARRLYEVRQSGCIATRALDDPRTVVLTTFGVFDTPRELPEPGPAFETLTATPEALLAACDAPSDAVRALVAERWPVLRSVLAAAAAAFRLERLHRFQWDAIQANLEYVATGAYRPVTVVRAPTGAGKTVVFLVNAAVSAWCGPERGSAVLMFPTRLLNEDMFRRLTAFVHAMREHEPTGNATGGLLMGTSDPLYRMLLAREPGEEMHHFGACPTCDAAPMIAVREQSRMVPECGRCGHRVGYMYTTYDVPAFLPDIIIATPDKLFYEATATSFEQYRIGLFGAPVRRCVTCGRACPSAYLALKPEAERCAAFHKPAGCPGTARGPTEVRAIRYMGFDEVHSLYGVTATYLSMFLADLEVTQAALSGRRVGIRYETATATISNERELIEALTRRRAAEGEIVLIPPQGEEASYFRIQDGTVRHRVLATLPTKMSSKQAFIRATLNAYLHLHAGGGGSAAPRDIDAAGRDQGELRGRGVAAGGELEERLAALTETPGDWRFLLGYLFKKQEGADMRRALRDMYRNAFGPDLRVEFLSGEAPKDQISQIVARALAGEIDILLANLVISLGVDIHGLNHMIMLGLTQGFTEFVQTAGRTGRGRSSGHVQIVLQPFNPRDRYLYRHFHAVLSDVAGYYDVLPVKSTNLHCAGEMFGNVAKSVLVALCLRLPQPRWAHASGIQQAVSAASQGEARVLSGISRILCDDPGLKVDTDALVATRFNALMDQLTARNSFLADLMTTPASEWLIRSLRGRSGSTVRVTCADDELLERLRAPYGGRADDGGESEE
ncbi:MAG TPA: helicase-related protein [Longimicrobium sp.]|nr:helicase-related protein [Longimicrobium sp.]